MASIETELSRVHAQGQYGDNPSVENLTIPEHDMLAIKHLYFQIQKSEEVTKRRTNAFKKQISKIARDLNKPSISTKLWNQLERSRGSR